MGLVWTQHDKGIWCHVCEMVLPNWPSYRTHSRRSILHSKLRHNEDFLLQFLVRQFKYGRITVERKEQSLSAHPLLQQMGLSSGALRQLDFSSCLLCRGESTEAVCPSCKVELRSTVDVRYVVRVDGQVMRGKGQDREQIIALWQAMGEPTLPLSDERADELPPKSAKRQGLYRFLLPEDGEN